MLVPIKGCFLGFSFFGVFSSRGISPGNPDFVFLSYHLFYFFMNLFIAKLNYDTTSEELREVFEGYGTVSSANVITDKFTSRSKGYGFVEMDDDTAAMTAIDELNDSELDGHTIVVKKAEPRKEHSYNRSN